MRSVLTLSVVLFVLAACSQPQVREVKYTMDIFEPTVDVEVLSTWPRDRKYFAIGELEVSTGDQANDALVRKARQMGADAIVVGPGRERSQVYVPIDSPLNTNSTSFRGVPLYSVRAVAIKYEP
mgnify:CR=1 FL=1|jgi:hypothetical protein